jgi:hypothetical protein
MFERLNRNEKIKTGQQEKSDVPMKKQVKKAERSYVGLLIL